jgi:hypothetical protein
LEAAAKVVLRIHKSSTMPTHDFCPAATLRTIPVANSQYGVTGADAQIVG